MKKLIAMVMTAAMVASLVPATAFAGDDIHATAKVVNSWTKKDTFKGAVTNSPKSAPELQIKLTDVGTQGTTPTTKLEFEIELENATFDADRSSAAEEGVYNANDEAALKSTVKVTSVDTGSAYVSSTTQNYEYELVGDDEIEAALKAYYADATKTSFASDVVNTSVAGKYVEYYINSSAPTDPAASPSTNAWSTKADWGSDVTAPVPDNTKVNAAAKAYVEAAIADTNSTAWYNKGLTAGNFTVSVSPNGTNYDITANITGGSSVGPETGVDLLAWAISVKDTNSDAAATLNAAGDGFILENEASWVTNEKAAYSGQLWKVTTIVGKSNADGATGSYRSFTPTVEITDTKDGDEIKLTVEVTNGRFENGDVISIDLLSYLPKSKNASVSVTSDDVTITNGGDDIVYVYVENEGITASIKKLTNIAVEEHTKLTKDVVIKSTVENFADNQKIELKLSSGFEFMNVSLSGNGTGYDSIVATDDDIITLTVNGTPDKIELSADDFEIEATSAKAGATAVLTVRAKYDATNAPGSFAAKTTVEVAKVVDYVVVMSVDEDEDLPVIYSGVNVDNYGLNDDSDHLSLEVTIEETFPGAWSFRKGFDLELPEGVYVTDVELNDFDEFYETTVVGGTPTSSEITSSATMDSKFVKAYQDGDHVNFEFEKRVFDDVNTLLNDDVATMSFQLELVADPGFSGDVTLKLKGDLVDEQEVTIAKFVKPYEVKAEQNDLIIDYRYTEIPSTIQIVEPEEGLWDADKAAFGLFVEKSDYIVFEDDPTFTVNEDSGMELDKDELGEIEDVANIALTDLSLATITDETPIIMAVVDKESDGEAGVITISDMSLFMQRSIPAGAYDLKEITSMAVAYENEDLFAPDCTTSHTHTASCSGDNFVGDVCDYSDTVKEAFVNVVTAGRDQDDASFTTKVVVPVGETKITAGEVEYTIDTPAYINANGYTMLPVRAVATALGIKNDNVLWDQATKTVTILYGQRIITMQVGASVVYVNGAAIPASSSVEITNNRTFLGLRDLATALGVTDITWDASTKTAILNGGNTAE